MTEWFQVNEFALMTPVGIKDVSSKIAAFDMDSTLITTKSGKKFPDGREDWVWWHPSVPKKLDDLHADGFNIVIFSNQSGVSSGKRNKDDILGKISDIATVLSQSGVPLTAMVAFERDKYRKPSTGMWDHFVVKYPSVSKAESFYCGDAAGREKSWDGNKKTPKDFACSDRKFAANVGIKFFTPEELFLSQQPTDKWSWGSFDPRQIPYIAAYPVIKVSKDQEVVLMVGCPASGKTSLSKELFSKHVRISSDELGSKAKCLNAAKKALSGKQSIVVDNLNSAPETRKEWIELAKVCGVENIRCVYMATPRDAAEHMNNYRGLLTGSYIPDIVYNIHFSKFKVPDESEGFTEIVHVPFGLLDSIAPERKALLLQWS